LKPQEIKTEFIRLRAEGQSYSRIAETLHISKSTCTAWERELKERISELKQEQLNELYNAYFMTREARIRRIGDTLNGINDALDGVDLTELPPEKLLDFKLKYTEALKEEYTGTTPAYMFDESIEPKDVVTALGNLLNRIRAGECTAEQASRESLVLANLLKAYEASETKARIDAIDAIIGGRA
jgi:hypothetical protein